jgi:hypothetical protein
VPADVEPVNETETDPFPATATTLLGALGVPDAYAGADEILIRTRARPTATMAAPRTRRCFFDKEMIPLSPPFLPV